MTTQPEPDPPGENVPSALAGFLSERRDFITARWIEAVRRNSTLEAAKQVNDVELADHLPKLFDDLSATLQGKQVVREAKGDAEAHGAHRWQQHYELEEVLEELGIVSRILLAHGLDAFADAHPDTPKEQLRGARERILRFFEDAAAGSVRQYVERHSRQMREHDLVLSEQRRLALDSAQMGWWHYDPASGQMSYDERYKAIFGVRENGLGYDQLMPLVHPEDRSRVDQAVAAAVRPDDPIPFACEYRVVRPDGTLRWVAGKGQVAFAGEGEARRTVSFAGTVTDITAAKAMQEALRASEAKYRLLFDSVDSAFCVLEMIWDEQGKPVDYRFVEVNSNFKDHNGLPDAAGKTALELIPNLETRWFEIFGRVSTTGRPSRFVEGSEAMGRWFDLYAFPMGPGERPHVAVLFSDITARLGAEEALRTAKAEAEAANRAKDDFLAALSHELRTPLTPVLMAAEDLCEDATLPAAARETLRMMQRNIGLEARLIDDLLDLTRIANGKLELRTQDCEAHSLAGLAVEIVRDEAQAKGITLGIDFAAVRTHFQGDPARVQQVFWNLLKNAVKFTPVGGEVSIRTRNEDDALVIEVSDTGVGLAPEYLERIFNPFEQAGLINNAKFGGLGLGLAIAKAIVELHGGIIRAESAGLGRGATFRVELAAVIRPLGIAAGDPDEATPAREATQLVSHVPMRLLLVEDHEATLNVLTRLLTRAGYSVATAASVAEAQKLAASENFEAVISDVGLPDGTGIELMESLHTRYGLRGIALTGYGMEEDVRRTREVGFIEHLVKPVDFAQLRRALARFKASE